MKATIKIVTVFLLCVTIRSIDSDGSPGNILIVTPHTIQADEPFTVSVLPLTAAAQGSQLNFKLIKHEGYSSEDVGIVKDFTSDAPLTLGEPTLITLTVPAADFDSPPEKLAEIADSQKHQWYRYYLNVSATEAGSEAALFEDRVQLSYRSDNEQTLIQTDKAVYKPGDLVRFRAVLLNGNMTPIAGQVNTYIYDPYPTRNLIQQKLSVKLNDYGVVYGELQLSDQLALGSWEIGIEKDGQKSKTSKSFAVEKYVLPKYEVTVTTPSFITSSDDATVTVTAKYTFGKPVAGAVTLTAKHSWNKRNTIKKTEELNDKGQAVFTFTNEELDKEEIVKRDYNWQQTIQFEALVIEALTGNDREASASLTAYPTDVKVDLQQSTNTYKPNLDYEMLVAVRRQDDTPITHMDIPRTVQLTETYEFPYDDQKLNESQCTSSVHVSLVDLDTDGTKKLNLRPPAFATSMRVQAQYDRSGNGKYRQSELRESVNLDASQSPSHSYLQLLATTNATQAGEPVKFLLKATNPFDKLYAKVISRNRILVSRSFPMTGTEAVIEFDTSTLMAPSATLVVFGVRPNTSEVVADGIKFTVDGFFRNQVSISVDPTQVEPANKVRFTVSAEPESFVGILAIDESVRLLRTGNDFDADDIKRRFGGGSPIRPYFGGWYRWALGGRVPQEVFDNAQLRVLTDAFMYAYVYTGNGGGGSLAKSMQAPMAAGFGGGVGGARGPMPQAAPSSADSANFQQESGGGSAPTPTVRKEFPETWIWTDLVSNDAGLAVYEATVPDTITTWAASAFAVHAHAGFGVADDLAKVTVFRTFFIQMNLPYSVKRGEKVALQVLVFNYDEKPQTTVVQLLHDETSGFDFLNADETPLDPATAKKGYNIRKVTIESGKSVSVSLPIQPTQLGHVMLKVQAIGVTVSDAVERPLLVEPEGYLVEQNTPIVVGLAEDDQRSVNVDLVWPPNRVEGSERAQVNVIGDIMGPIMGNIDRLVRMPSGCGEQNMVNFVPNVVVLQYLDATQREEADLRQRAERHVRSGYQRQLTYRRNDGSFSAFGNDDPSGSVWLTAFVFRSFNQAKAYVTPQDKLMTEMVAYMQKRLTPSGMFLETGEVHNKYMQGGAGSHGLPLTAYVAIALMEGNVSFVSSLPEPITRELSEDAPPPPMPPPPQLTLVDGPMDAPPPPPPVDGPLVLAPEGPIGAPLPVIRPEMEQAPGMPGPSVVMPVLKADAEERGPKPKRQTPTEYTQRVETEKGDTKVNIYFDYSTGPSVVMPVLKADAEERGPKPKRQTPTEYLEQNVKLLANEPYGLALTAYALHLADSPKKNLAWQLLEALAVKETGLQYWTDNVDQSDRERNSYYYWRGPRSVDVEMTSYALLTMMLRGDTNGALPVVRWLNTQRNTFGGWASTQDTVVALQALAQYAAAVYSPDKQLAVSVTNGDAQHTFTVNKTNQLVYQTYKVPDVTQPVQLTVDEASKGVAFAQVQWTYHMTEPRADRPFECDQQISPIKGGLGYILRMCCAYKKAERSNMAVMELGTLSGFTVDKEKLNKLTKVKHTQRVETEKGDTKVNIYFDYLTQNATCVDISSDFVYSIGNLKDASVLLYDYYDTDDRIEMKYTLADKPSFAALCPKCWELGH